ncbi:hypothetical protein MtrunA17_Chr5g0409521 [Medicago truncatula]|uniref:Transmembrane protein n=1 Tax=Medicago truncatula TaxID=3880 RepID=A0A396HMW7_MEDTR|nr:hypothetical protein MtrunA17_Chr5g0409521 [Medicago truncatula]
MNHPDGDCPLCLFPLVTEDHQSETLPFMKLMSCFHCFHRWGQFYPFIRCSIHYFIILDFFRTSMKLTLYWFNIAFSISNFSFQFFSIIIGSECIIRWWNWIQSSKETGSANSDNATAHCNRGMYNCNVTFDDQRKIILLYS